MTSTLNNGTTTPVWDPNNPASPPSTYHAFGAADRFNFAPLNLLLTPSQRKSIWTSVSYDPTDDLQLYAKGMFNNRTSTNQAAPEPIFVGPYAGTGGIADTIDVSRLNPYNPFGIDLCSVAQAPNSSVCPGGPQLRAELRLDHAPSDRGRPARLQPGRQHLVLQHRAEGHAALCSMALHWDLNFVDTR